MNFESNYDLYNVMLSYDFYATTNEVRNFIQR